MTGHGLLALVAGCVLACAGHAQPTIWRCDSDARLYADKPCPGAQPLRTGPTPSAQRLAEAREVARRELTLAEQLRERRHEREQAVRPVLPAGIVSASQARQRASLTREAGAHIERPHHRRPGRAGKLAAAPKDPRVTLELRVPARAAMSELRPPRR